MLRSVANIFRTETLGEFRELKKNMLENEEYIISNIEENDPEKKKRKIIRWFRINEAPTEPLHPSKFLPEWERNFEDDPEQQDSCDNLTKSGQSTPSTKRKRKKTAQKSEAQKLDWTEKPKTKGHKMRFLVGYDNGIMNATITTSKEEIDRKFQYPGKKQ